MIFKLENERLTMDQQSLNLPKGKNIKNELDQWIWEILNI